MDSTTALPHTFLTSFPSLFLFPLFGLVKAREVILRSQVDRLGLFALFFLTFTLELQRLLAPTVHLDYLKRPLGIDGHQIGRHLLVGRIGNLFLEYIGLEVIICIVGRLEAHILLGRNLELST